MAPGWLLSTLLPSLGLNDLGSRGGPWPAQHTVSQGSSGFILPFRDKRASRLVSLGHNRAGEWSLSLASSWALMTD